MWSVWSKHSNWIKVVRKFDDDSRRDTRVKIMRKREEWLNEIPWRKDIQFIPCFALKSKEKTPWWFKRAKERETGSDTSHEVYSTVVTSFCCFHLFSFCPVGYRTLKTKNCPEGNPQWIEQAHELKFGNSCNRRFMGTKHKKREGMWSLVHEKRKVVGWLFRSVSSLSSLSLGSIRSRDDVLMREEVSLSSSPATTTVKFTCLLSLVLSQLFSLHLVSQVLLLFPTALASSWSSVILYGFLSWTFMNDSLESPGVLLHSRLLTTITAIIQSNLTPETPDSWPPKVGHHQIIISWQRKRGSYSLSFLPLCSLCFRWLCWYSSTTHVHPYSWFRVIVIIVMTSVSPQVTLLRLFHHQFFMLFVHPRVTLRQVYMTRQRHHLEAGLNVEQVSCHHF